MPRGFSVATVRRDSPAHRVGVEAGDRLLMINGSYFYDLLDYHYLCADAELTLTVINKNGASMRRRVKKEYDENLGLEFTNPTIGPLRRCRNNCIFCFIDQQPGHLRSSLYQKDDDYRLSFFHGNYISLTNVGQGDLKRIVRRGISPLYISIHVTEPGVRSTMMGNRAAGNIINQLAALANAGITMHGQVVICPGYNDGAVLQKTITDLAQFYPYLKTVALVPVGLTRYRKGLTAINPITPQEAQKILEACSLRQKSFIENFDTPFLYLADEFYLLAGSPLPPHHHYGKYEQVENGVGLVRLFLNDLSVWKQNATPELKGGKNISLVTSEAAAPFLHLFLEELQKITGLTSNLYPLKNHFWGGNVNVAGLLTGSDLIRGLDGKNLGEILFIPAVMLKEESELFLDGYSLAEVSAALKVQIIPVDTLLEIRKNLEEEWK